MADDRQIRLEGLRKRFGSLAVLKGIDLTVCRGEVVVIMGASGSGKTTLIRCINFLEEPDEGRVVVCGLEVSCGRGAGGRERARCIREIRTRVGMVFQHFNLFPHMSVLQNCMLAPMRSLRASGWQMLVHLEIPAATPVLMAGLRTSVTLAVIGAVVGEFVSAQAGLGYLVTVARNQYDTPLVLVAVLTMTTIARVLYSLVSLVERRVLRWQTRVQR